jgi:hypothetical protein
MVRMKIKIIQIVTLMALSVVLVSCITTSPFIPGSGNKYRYVYKMVYPIRSSNLKFQDDSIIVQFKFDDAAVQLQLQNISDSNITLDWDKVSLGINNRFYRVRHASTMYVDTVRSNTSMMPPLGYLRDLVIPHENIYNDGDTWVETDLLPTVDRRSPSLQDAIKKNVGQKLSLMLPIQFGSTTRNYVFNFQVDAVKQIAWKDFTPVKRVPASPKTENKGRALEHVTTAVIVVGVLGFSAYVLSIKKNPPVE